MKAFTIALSLVFLIAGPARAEPGDYSAVETILNLFFPPAADNPVTPAQETGPYPLNSNPAGFVDGFDPALYLGWQTIQLAPETGAVCGNGSPYKFFVNRSITTSNMTVYMEGGGACWDYESCTGSSSLGARNPNGIPDDYLDLTNFATALVSPFVFRFHPGSDKKTEAWTMVYVPYCTGDTYTGDTIATYDNPDPTGPPLVWHHNGLRNVRAVVAWLKNNLERPVQMLSTGCSAGGTGSLANYAHLRRDMAPDSGFLLNDSGPIVPAVADTGNGVPSLSFPLHTKIRTSWGLDGPGDQGVNPIQQLDLELPSFEPSDMGTLNAGLADRFPNDRLGHTQFWQDYNYSRYSYEEFYDFIANEPDPAVREIITRLFWYADTVGLLNALQPHPNFGIYVPNLRALNDSHCSTIVDFEHGDIQELGLELDDFIDDLLDGTGPVLHAAEQDWSVDPAKPPNLLYVIVDSLL